MHEIAIINYGMGNINSVANALEQLGAKFFISEDPKNLYKAKAVILPGVGAFPTAMRNLCDMGLDHALNEQVIQLKKPFLGICLGMQLIAEESYELGFTKGLGWIKGKVKKLDHKNYLLIPHVGWNNVYYKHSKYFQNIEQNSNFFFDHSFHLECPPEIVIATSDYGKSIVAAIAQENIFAVQFHPEKSQRTGLKLLRNFLNIVNSD